LCIQLLAQAQPLNLLMLFELIYLAYVLTYVDHENWIYTRFIEIPYYGVLSECVYYYTESQKKNVPTYFLFYVGQILSDVNKNW